ncbi:MAG: efflux RND transporter permease subunit [Rhodospirillaceae bacterium]
MKGVNLSEWALGHRSLVVYFMLVILVAGAFSYLRLGRNEDPSFTIKTMVVQAAWPGADVDDTLHQVTERIERKLQETPGLDYIKSYTTPGQTTIFVTLLGATPGRAVPDIWYQVRKKIGDIRPTLPAGVVGPNFNDEFGDTYGIIYGFTADGFSHRELRDHVDEVRRRLLQVKDVSRIDVLGAQDERIYVEFSTAHLAGLGLDPSTLTAALRAQNAIVPAGVIQTGDEKLVLRVSGGFESERDLLDVNFVANGRMLRLGDIAEVRRTTADPPQPLFRVNGEPAIGLAVAMRDGGDNIALGGAIRQAMAEITADLPIGVEPRLIADQPEVVGHAVGEFMKALWEAIAIVLAVSFVSLGLRAGTVVALAIPLVLAIVFMTMMAAGIDLQRVSLGALIIALGLLVDDAMITVESMITRLEAGADLKSAASYAYTSTAFPMLTGTLVTVAGFVPIGFARSSAGEYTFSIFAVVGIALIASWVTAVVFAPLLGVALLPETKGHGHAAAPPGKGKRLFERLLLTAMRYRFLTIAATLALFAGAVFAVRFVPQQFFPPSDRPELVVDLKLSQASSIYAGDRASVRLDRLLKDDPDIDHWSSYVGRGAVRFYLPLNVQLANDFFAETVIVTRGLEARERVRARLEAALATELPEALARIYPLELGPPVGWPLQYRVSGPDPERVRAIAYQVAGVLADDPYARKVNFDWIEPARAIRVKVDQDQARLAGLSSQALAQTLNVMVSGTTVTQVRDDIYLVDVVARAVEEQRLSLTALKSLQVPLPNGRSVPLSQIASFAYDQEYPLIWRRDRVPTLTVQADVAPGRLPAAIVMGLKPRIDQLNATLPPGYHIVAGGTVEESAKSQASIAAVAPFMLLLTFTILMIQLESFQRLFLVLSVTPFGLIGVVGALLLFHQPLGFVAILGILALIGMIARNSVILIDQIETEISGGLTPWNAVIAASSNRVRPILLTAAAAILGMIPIASSVFWGPMAVAIMGGLVVATLLTLLFLPALYVAWFRVKAP